MCLVIHTVIWTDCVHIRIMSPVPYIDT